MIKSITIFFVSFFSISSFALSSCPVALPTSNPNFCTSFAQVAQCHCMNYGLPLEKCINVEKIYGRMLNIYTTLEKACKFQRDTSAQNCIDSWNCYRLGGVNSQGELCSSTGNACQ